MAENVFLKLKANGADVDGDSSETTLERENSIECTAFSVKGMAATSRDHQVTGRRQYEVITFTKAVDRSTPLLAKAFTENQVVSAEFRFFRDDGTGTDEHYFTIEVGTARVRSVRQFVLDTQDPANAALPPQEEVTIGFGTIEWTWVDGGITHEDTWNTNR
jgi:type VI secretion system secreted protein Hcp